VDQKKPQIASANESNVDQEQNSDRRKPQESEDNQNDKDNET
jgi:hypothetical protein